MVSGLIFEGEIQEVFGRRKLKKALDSLENHYIVCGYGRMGKVICNELKAKRNSFCCRGKRTSGT